MQIKYKIVESWPAENSIVVRYYTDVLTEEKLGGMVDGKYARGRTDCNINLPIPTPVGDDLHRFIAQRAPVAWLEMMEMVADPNVETSLSSIPLHEEKVFTPPIDPHRGYFIPDARLSFRQARQLAVSATKVTTRAGNTFDGDELSQGRMARAVLALTASQKPSMKWVLADNSVIEATQSELNEALTLASEAQSENWIV